jgi:hypothetical protein
LKKEPKEILLEFEEELSIVDIVFR